MGKSAVLDTELLKECEQSAQESAQYAKASLDLICYIVQKEADNIRRLMTDVVSAHSEIQNNPVWRDLADELTELKKYSEVEIERIREDIENRCREMEKFTVVVFGKTTAGKSTLMEILTNGDGSTIGKGAQRTTRDVRSYEWNGLKIWDVPGFAAADGQEDEDVAYDAVPKGDLILFLLTNNKATPKEAEAMSRIRDLGKPVLGIMNVRVSTNRPDKILKKDIEKAYASRDISDIIHQFFEFGTKSHHQDWSNIEFVPVHLKCAFDAMHTTDPQKRDLYNSLSHFSNVTYHIAEYVKNRGRVFRLKTFVDIVEKPLMDLLVEIREFQVKLAQNCRLFVDESNNIAQKGNSFLDKIRSEAEAKRKNLRTEIMVALDSFVETNHEKDKETINRNFRDFISRRNIEQKMEEFANRTIDNYNFLLKNEGKSFAKNYSFYSPTIKDLAFSGGELVDVKKWAGYVGNVGGVGGAVNLIGRGLAAANLIKSFTPFGMTITVAQFGIAKAVEYFADDIDVKHKNRKKELKDEITPIIDYILTGNFAEFNGIIKQIEDNINDINHRNRMFKKLFADVEDIHAKNILPGLTGIIGDLNGYLIESALKSQLVFWEKVERKIGVSMTIYLRDGENFTGSNVSLLENMLQEKVIVVGGV
ncbi:MAG: 50S ribosome-binding GTPase [Selenomonadaceae bacterium]|nr:50S ribosome-binding GTPase [Selenomonadaceae bacterium]